MFSASLHFILMRNLRSVRLREGDPGPRLTDQLLYHTGKCLEVAMECAWTRSEHLDLPDPKIYVKNTLLVFWVCTLVSQMYLGSEHPPPPRIYLQPFSGFLQESSQSNCRCQPAKQLWTRRPLYPRCNWSSLGQFGLNQVTPKESTKQLIVWAVLGSAV